MQRRRFLALAGAGAASLGVPRPRVAGDRSWSDTRFDDIAGLIEARMAGYAVPGVAFGVAKGGAVRTQGFGITNVDNPQPVTPDTVFPIASISKTVVGTAMMRLVDEGLVDVEAPVVEYLPEFRVADETATREVRVWHLLTHTPGWEGQLGTPDHGSASLADFVATLRDVPQLARPGEVWSYNNAGWAVAGRVVEKVTGGTIHEALDDRVFRPLGLDRAFTRTGEAMSYRFAVGHVPRGGKAVVARPFSLPANVAAGGCAMSVESLLWYARFHLGDGVDLNGDRVMSRASLHAMRAPRIGKQPSADGMGLGWHLRTLDGVVTAQHGGTLAGHCLHVQLVPERDLCFAILTNHADGWKLNEEVAAEILRRYEGIALEPNQRTGANRGGNERMNLHAAPLAAQPPLHQYVGLYDRTPVGDVGVGLRDGRLWIGGADDGWGLTFYAVDMAYSTGPGAFAGLPVEFVRDAGGAVRWVRVNGRIARRTNA